MAIKLSEDDLCEYFADHLVQSKEFRFWVLSNTKFADQAQTARLLDQEQMTLRPRKRWWRHWWCNVPSLNHQRETDIFCVFEGEDGRFALHVENKLGKGEFLPGQAEGYRPRAQFMARQKRFMNYSEFETILLAPVAFIADHATQCACFDRVISHEKLGVFIPEFRLS